MSDFDDKVAAEAIAAYPVLRSKVAELTKKLASYEKKERVSNILKVAEAKQMVLEDNEDALLKASEEKLAAIETTLRVVHSAGNLKMGEVEDDEEGEEKKAAAGEGMNPLDQFCLDPVNFDPKSIGQGSRRG